MRVDHYLSSRDTLNFRYMFLNGTRFDPLSTSGAGVPGFPVGENHRTQNFVAQLTHTFSPSVVSIARFAFLRNKFLFDEHLEQHFSGLSRLPVSNPRWASRPARPSSSSEAEDTPASAIPSPDRATPMRTPLRLAESLTWIHGRHELKFGGDYRRDQINVVNGIASNGFFVFIPAPLTNAFANFLIGQPFSSCKAAATSRMARGDLSRGLRGNDFNFYAQDTYKVNSRLTLNLGLRYDLPFPYTEIRNRQNLFVPGVQSKVIPPRRWACSIRVTRASPAA